MNDELTVLDYVKALLTPWRGAPPPIPPLEMTEPAEKAATQPPEVPVPVEEPVFAKEEPSTPPVEIVEEQSKVFPWRSVIALGLALAAQISLEPGPDRSWGLGVIVYAISASLLVWANLKGEWSLPEYPAVIKQIDQMQVRWLYLSLGGVSSLLAFITMGGNQFTLINTLLWISAIIFTIFGFWKPSGESLKSNWLSLVHGRSSCFSLLQ
jgi:hypothetical protein